MHYTKGALLVDGGEGEVYALNETSAYLLKLYKETDPSGEAIITPDLQKKLEYMERNQPVNLVEKSIVAWPIELVKSNGGIIGFIMPKLEIDAHIQGVYSYRHPIVHAQDYQDLPSVKSRIAIAINLCSFLHEVHQKGYVIGDFNHRNIGVNRHTGQIHFVDCDSFHITDETGNVYRTNVIMPGYLAPEIIWHCINERAKGQPHNLDKVALPTFTNSSDLFCLAIHIFRLLMNGTHPFNGVKENAIGSTAAPFVGNEGIERDAYVFGHGKKPSAVFCPSSTALPPAILALFNRAFVEGRKDPSQRPSAEEWYYALQQYLTNEITQCIAVEKHQYYSALSICPYCIADEMHMRQQEHHHQLQQQQMQPQQQAAINPQAVIPGKRVIPLHPGGDPHMGYRKRNNGLMILLIVILVLITLLVLTLGILLNINNPSSQAFAYSNGNMHVMDESDAPYYAQITDESENYIPDNTQDYIYEPYHIYHTVESGEFMSFIAFLYFGSTEQRYVDLIVETNGLENPEHIYTGQVLIIPGYVPWGDDMEENDYEKDLHNLRTRITTR